MAGREWQHVSRHVVPGCRGNRTAFALLTATWSALVMCKLMLHVAFGLPPARPPPSREPAALSDPRIMLQPQGEGGMDKLTAPNNWYIPHFENMPHPSCRFCRQGSHWRSPPGDKVPSPSPEVPRCISVFRDTGTPPLLSSVSAACTAGLPSGDPNARCTCLFPQEGPWGKTDVAAANQRSPSSRLDSGASDLPPRPGFTTSGLLSAGLHGYREQETPTTSQQST